MSDTYSKSKKMNIINILTSPLAGEVCFRLERKPAKVRKQGEGYRNQCAPFTPHQEFLKLVTSFWNSILSHKGRGLHTLITKERL